MFLSYFSELRPYITCSIKYILWIISIFASIFEKIHVDMERKLLNRIKVVLAEKDKSNKWLSEQLDKDPAILLWFLQIIYDKIGLYLSFLLMTANILATIFARRALITDILFLPSATFLS